jgi:hypothetical protein
MTPPQQMGHKYASGYTDYRTLYGTPPEIVDDFYEMQIDIIIESSRKDGVTVNLLFAAFIAIFLLVVAAILAC